MARKTVGSTGTDEIAGIETELALERSASAEQPDTGTDEIASLAGEIQDLKQRELALKTRMRELVDSRYSNATKASQSDHIAAIRAATELLRKDGKLHGSSRRRR